MNKRNKKNLRRMTSFMMAMVLALGSIFPTSSYVYATDADMTDINTAEQEAEAAIPNTDNTERLKMYSQVERTDLEPSEVAIAEDIIVAAGYGFDVENCFDGISYDMEMVNISYCSEISSFDADKTGSYITYYKAEPVSGKEAYLICRIIYVSEIETDDSDIIETDEAQEDGGGQEDVEAQTDDENVTITGQEPETANYSLSYGEIEGFNAGDDMVIQMASLPVLQAAAVSSDKSGMKVSCSGYAKYCGRSIGIKYISESGDYYHHLVFCLNLNKNSTNGTVEASASKSSIKPEITYCMVNGARKLNGTCHNDKYSAGSAAADYFITSAAIHVLNGEVKLSYYNNGSNVYKKISTMVSDAKNYDEDEYDEATGTTKSITYTISPKKSEWQYMGDGLYRSKEKFVRTKSGTITNVSYKITGQPSGLTVGCPVIL